MVWVLVLLLHQSVLPLTHWYRQTSWSRCLSCLVSVFTESDSASNAALGGSISSSAASCTPFLTLIDSSTWAADTATSDPYSVLTNAVHLWPSKLTGTGTCTTSAAESECFSSSALISTNSVFWCSFRSVSAFTVWGSSSVVRSRGSNHFCCTLHDARRLLDLSSRHCNFSLLISIILDSVP